MSSRQGAQDNLDWVAADETPQYLRRLFSAHFPQRSTAALDAFLAQTAALFAGRYPGYQASDSAYHDFNHTLAATVATARLLDGHIKSQQAPTLSARDFELAIAGILLHDSGFIKEVGDTEGTGAKYTLTHVARSAAFAAEFLPPLGLSDDEIRIVQLAIQCTGLNVEVSKLRFRDDRERFIGCALGTGDILGQMADPDYPQRLPALYEEYQEATAFSGEQHGHIAGYKSADDLMRQTRRFYEEYACRMLATQWAGVQDALKHHFTDGKNHYIDAIETNLTRIDNHAP